MFLYILKRLASAVPTLLVGITLGLAVAIAVKLGKFTAARPNGRLDRAVMALAASGVTVPNFAIATLLDFPAVIAVLKQPGDRTDQSITRIFPFSEAAQAFPYWDKLRGRC